MLINYQIEVIKQKKVETNLKQFKNKNEKKLTPKSCGHKTVPSIISKVSELIWGLWTQ